MKFGSEHGLAFGLSAILADKMALSAFQTRTPVSPPASFLVTRCPGSSVAQLNTQGVCFCGPASTSIAVCDGLQYTDRTTICVEDLRHGGKRHATCGLEFSKRPEECPMSYTRLMASKDHYICQDSASVHSCGAMQQDCLGSQGTLTAECVEGECKVTMCKEGWRFKIRSDGIALCVPSKPMFFTG